MTAHRSLNQAPDLTAPANAAPSLAAPESGTLMPPSDRSTPDPAIVECEADVPPVVEDVTDDDRPERLAAALGLTFRDLDLLRLALTHRSVLHDWVAAGGMPLPSASNERLEFVGDAVLGAIVARQLYDRFPEADEGTLTALRVALVRTETIVAWARELHLGDYLYLGQGEKITAGARDRMLAGAFEALIGAIALDGGLRGATRFLRRFLARANEPLVVPPEETNPKGRLQEVVQERFRLAPDYHMLRIEGPAHAREFTVAARIDDRVLGVGGGASKRAAEQEAARAALVMLAGESNGAATTEDGDRAQRVDGNEPEVEATTRNGVCPPGIDAEGERMSVVEASESDAAAGARRSGRRRSDG